MFLLILAVVLPLSCGSYLDSPRINFVGRLRVDANTINNMRCNYDTTQNLEDSEANPNSNVNGTNECSFLDTKVTSVVDSEGILSIGNELVGADILNNHMQPFAKMIDLDVDVQGKSVIYGMTISLTLENGTRAFEGSLVPSVVSQDYWFRVKCYGPMHSGKHPFDISFALGAQATSRITNITWNPEILKNSPVLRALKEQSESQNGNGDLSMRLSFHFYTRTYQPFLKKNFTLAHIVGSISSTRNAESLNFGGDRILTPTHYAPPSKIKISESDSCYGQDLQNYLPWLFKVPFKVNYVSKLLHVDMSNALPVDTHGSLRDLGPIQLGIFRTITSQYPEFCILPIGGPIPYMEQKWLSNTGGIVTYSLDDQQLDDLRSSKLVLYQEINETDDSDDLGIKFCGEVFHSIKGTHLAQVLIEESQYFVRPLDSYVQRMEYGDQHETTLLVTEYGFPVENVLVVLKQSNPDVLPVNGLIPESWSVKSDTSGHATFSFRAQLPIPYPRYYVTPPCAGKDTTSLPIDGQVYTYKYCIQSECPPDIKFLFVSELSYLVFSTVDYKEPYTWVEHIQPIFAQYHHLTKTLSLILNLTDYHWITKPSNLRLVRSAMTHDFNHPNFMPVTRDLSPSKTKMVLTWLDNPIYSLDGEPPTNNNSIKLRHQCKLPKRNLDPEDPSVVNTDFPRCHMSSIPVNSHPIDTDPYLKSVLSTDVSSLPLNGLDIDETVCNVENIRKQLQIGIKNKLYTISLYLTSLYSMVEGCNPEFIDLFTDIAQREMMHLYYTGLLLHRLGQAPDMAGCPPVFPRSGLPGNILGNLQIDLKKASLQQLHDLFLVLNIPPREEETIGIDRLYSDVVECLKFADIRNEVDRLLRQSSAEENSDQYSSNTSCMTIHNVSDALNVLDKMVSRKENSKLEDTTFHQIEEIVCGKRLVVHPDNKSYAYVGDAIPFNSKAVLSMMDNPRWEKIEENSNCHTRVRVFNQVYNKLLLNIEESFSSEEDMYFEAMQLMKSIHIHFKKVLWTEKDSFSAEEGDGVEACGPIFN